MSIYSDRRQFSQIKSGQGLFEHNNWMTVHYPLHNAEGVLVQTDLFNK